MLGYNGKIWRWCLQFCRKNVGTKAGIFELVLSCGRWGHAYRLSCSEKSGTQCLNQNGTCEHLRKIFRDYTQFDFEPSDLNYACLNLPTWKHGKLFKSEYCLWDCWIQCRNCQESADSQKQLEFFVHTTHGVFPHELSHLLQTTFRSKSAFWLLYSYQILLQWTWESYFHKELPLGKDPLPVFGQTRTVGNTRCALISQRYKVGVRVKMRTLPRLSKIDCQSENFGTSLTREQRAYCHTSRMRPQSIWETENEDTMILSRRTRLRGAMVSSRDGRRWREFWQPALPSFIIDDGSRARAYWRRLKCGRTDVIIWRCHIWNLAIWRLVTQTGSWKRLPLRVPTKETTIVVPKEDEAAVALSSRNWPGERLGRISPKTWARSGRIGPWRFKTLWKPPYMGKNIFRTSMNMKFRRILPAIAKLTYRLQYTEEVLKALISQNSGIHAKIRNRAR